MTVPQGHYAQFITKDIIGVVYAAPLKVDFVNFRMNESIFTLNPEEESQEFNSMIVVDAKTIAICSIHDDNHCIVSLWGFFSEKKELEVVIPLPEHYEGLKLNSLLNGTVLITVASNKKEDYSTCFFIWDCKSPTVNCKFILPFLASCIAVLTSNEIVFRANSNGAAGGGEPHLHRLELSTQQCTPFEKPNGYVGFSDFIILSNRNIVMIGYKRLSLWSSYQLVSRSPSQSSSIVSIAEYNNTPNLIFVHSETVIRIIDVLTWDCIQLITINAIHDKIISCNATLLGISFGETITVYDFSLFGSMRTSSNNTNDCTRSILQTSPSHDWKKRNLPFFLSFGKNQVIIIDENLAEKIVQLKLSKMGVNYFHENEKTGIIESEFPMIIPSGDKEQFLYITLYKVAVWSLQLQSNPFIMSHNNSIVGGIIFSFTPYIILIERIAAGKFCLKIYISASSFEYDFDIGTKLPELYEVLNQPILLIKIESKCYFLHLEKRKLKICNELDDMIPFVSSDVLQWITDPSKLSFMIDKINWGAETLTFRMFDWNSLYVYSRQNSLPLFAIRNGATQLGRISLDSNDRSFEFYYGENGTLFDLEKKSYYTLATDSPLQYEPSTIQSIVKKLSSVRGNRVEN